MANVYFIGVDGGGTKTEAILYNEQFGILDSVIERASNPQSTSFRSSIDVVNRIIDRFLDFPHLPERASVYLSMGIAGLGRESDRQKWLTLFQTNCSSLSRISMVELANDAVIALYSGTYGKNGIVSICGTGSITFGINDNKLERIGGWGHLVDADRGSGYSIGYEALKAVFNMYDGIGTDTIITNLILKKEQVHKVPELVHKIYQTNDEKNKIASFATTVLEAATLEDEVAVEIIEKTAKYIATLGVTLHERLFLAQQKIPFVLVGGVFQSQRMMDQVAANVPRYLEITTTELSPVMGAVVNMLKKMGRSSEQIRQTLSASIGR